MTRTATLDLRCPDDTVMPVSVPHHVLDKVVPPVV